ncbi:MULTISPECIES: amidohydrolase family protein [Staphylococcus]|jgi:cytosine deaminase|uniref:Amidohydrolase family protein n=2 Tax=Staphylococcus nepalensis TaxID=214473 RepID=A0A2T4S9Q8_9STAP|nr:MULTISPECIES: amidohydrolase family protein [Staphylococcus]VDG65838.1 amidohydrolase [Lacrimispora indolis]MBO1212283.1 amidohydrolase family protein [Staphylococcus nepalensis]MBO1217080.1 amidohydrolase family protein [Staphylococcus nepalensis]MBO1227760.1 amidohydrolase family protein [Staphylococcus nepalensis]MBO1235342.1 amidohydrolase family protein [Staphylococcus nepalensis]
MSKKFINVSIYKHDKASEILVENGKFKAFGNNLGKADEIIDLEGALVLPPYVDAHLHLDYYFTGQDPQIKNTSGTLFEAIDLWNDYKKGTTKEEMKSRMRQAVNDVAGYGTQYIRAQTDCTDPNLTGIKAALEVRDELKDNITIQVVAFPQNGMYSFKEEGKTGRDLVEEALRLGADCVGGIPHNEWSPEEGVESIKEIVRLAIKYDKLIDVHCDETDDTQARFLEKLNAEAMKQGYGQSTTASHTCSFGSADDAYAFRMMGLFRQSGLNFVSCPTENLYLQGRQDTYPKRRGLTRVKEFVDNGINVAFGQDSIVDLWYPAGSGNLMNILDNGLHATQLMREEDFPRNFDLITYNGAKLMGLGDIYGLSEGKPANFIVLDAPNVFEAQRRRVDCIASIRNGSYLFKKETPKFTTELDIDRKTK